MIARLVHLQGCSHTCRDSNTGSLGAKQACMQFENSLHTFQSHIHSSHMLHPSSATRSLILDISMCVEKSVFSIWVDLFLCRSIQLLVLSYAEMFVYMYLSQLMSTFTNYLKVHHLLDGFFIPRPEEPVTQQSHICIYTLMSHRYEYILDITSL